MRKAAVLFLLLTLVDGCRDGGAAGPPRPDVMGVALGAGREEAHKRLNEIGRLEREERKQQEVWALREDPSYSHLIVSYDKEYKGVRFVTAVAKNDGGRPVRYDEVMDTSKAQKAQAGESVTYTLRVEAKGGAPGYDVKAIGGPKHVKYYSVEKVEQ